MDDSLVWQTEFADVLDRLEDPSARRALVSSIQDSVHQGFNPTREWVELKAAHSAGEITGAQWFAGLAELQEKGLVSRS